MPLPWSPGPVFVYESMVASRRSQLYALRALFVTGLLAGLAMVWLSLDLNNAQAIAQGSIRPLARMGQQFYYALATIQIAVVLVVAPAATAGAICLDRARGALTHMMVTDLSDREIVVGKLAARLGPVFGLVIGAVPVMALASLLGGIIPESLVALTLVTLALAILGSALALAISVRASKTHEVTMAVFALWGVWILGTPLWSLFGSAGMMLPKMPDWLLMTNPFALAWAPYSWPGWVGRLEIALFLAGSLGISAMLVGYAILRLRADARERAGRLARGRGFSARWLASRFGPSLDRNPVLWHEWHRSRPSRMARVVWSLYALSSMAGAGLVVAFCMARGPMAGIEIVGLVNALLIGLGLMLVSLSAPTAMAEERVRGSLDVLLATPLSTPAIVLAKWRGAFRMVPRLAIVPAVLTILMALTIDDASLRAGPVGIEASAGERLACAVLPIAFSLAHGAVVTSLGLALATWISRPGRAIAICISLYVLWTIGGLLVLELDIVDAVLIWLGISDPRIPGNFGMMVSMGFAALNPLGSQVTPFVGLTEDTGTLRLIYWLIQWTSLLILVSFAAALLAFTILTFERCVGRAPERPRKARKRPQRLRKASSPAASQIPEREFVAIEA